MGLVLTHGWSVTRSAFPNVIWRLLVPYVLLGEVWAILWYGIFAPESSGSVHNSSPVQRERGIVNVALITAGC